MLAKILFVSDLHKRYTDMRSVKNILPVQHKIQEELIAFNKSAGVTHNVILGDWYDRGFHGLGQAYSAMEEDRLLSKSVDGRVYLCMGNHFFLERDENPEMYIIQPCEYMKPRNLLQLAEEPIFKVVPTLKLGTVQISFFHFSKTNKKYVAPRDPDTTFHIGIYHDDRCVPSWVREREGFGGYGASYELNSIYANIDLAIHGHIHSDIGITALTLDNGRRVPLWIPGALGMTQDKDTIKHPYVELPLLEINDDSTVSTQKVRFSTHLDELQFYRTESKTKKPMSMMEMQAKNPVSIVTPSLQSYLVQQGVNDKQLQIVDEAGRGSLTLHSAVSIVTGGSGNG